MPAGSQLGAQLQELIAELHRAGIRHALIGGLALAPHGVIRATSDIDLLTAADSAGQIDGLLTKLGYQRQHRSVDAGNYLRGSQRLDLLYAHRPAALAMLAAAVQYDTAFGPLPVVSAEALIGLKLQALVNNPRRTQDLEDIRALLRANRGRLNLDEVRGYFRLFERESQLEKLLDETG